MLFRFWVFPDCTFLDISIILTTYISPREGVTVGEVEKRRKREMSETQLSYVKQIKERLNLALVAYLYLRGHIMQSLCF